MPLKKMTPMFQLANPVSSGAGSGLRFHIESTDLLTCVHKSVFELLTALGLHCGSADQGHDAFVFGASFLATTLALALVCRWP